ncbi:hypothetical protein OOK29_26045 [Streptomyces phaeochromogenes]|uniref:VG15 protein n=1 Tax=Streptomyces phaeochromogenes TaxID=1923 RepID=UPI00225B1671|nr:hypothetical protein [Streptomyces phaeochromogenes]MCX5601617.1 hypothetical protein [Streptomyces phaeochromogenes]
MAPTLTSRSARAIALAFQAAQARRSRLTANEIQRLWRQLDPRDLSGSWETSVGPRIVRAITAGQLASAAVANEYVDEVVDADGADPDRAGRARPEAFAGAAADGRSLESLMYLSVITTKQAIGGGLSLQDSLLRGLHQALRLGASETTQAGRSAVGASMAGKRTIQGYVRVVQPPACGRCVILAGIEFGWNKGFQRHPRCDCIHLPTTLIARNQHRGSLRSDAFSPTTRPGSGPRGFISPRAYFDALSRAEQDRVFTAAGAAAIREGGDMAQIVNARRGMYTTTAYGRTLRATREGTTRRGYWYRQERARTAARTGTRFARDRIEARQGLPRFELRSPRLLPEEIFRLAESRDEAVAMLRRFGYLT